MKKLYIKDKKQRIKFFKFYIKILCLKSIHSNLNLTINLRLKSFLLLKTLSKNSRIKIKNRCIFSNRGKSIESKLKISRIVFRNLISKGLISNILKDSW